MSSFASQAARRGAAQRVSSDARRGRAHARTPEEADAARDAAGKPTKRSLRGGLPARAQAKARATHVGVLRDERGDAVAEFPMVASADDPDLFGILTEGELDTSWELSIEREGSAPRAARVASALLLGRRLNTWYYAIAVA